MISWREKIWVKIVALTISGVFLFTEVTWAARADWSFSMPEATPNTNQETPYNSGFNDVLWQIYQDITSFLIPSAHAYEEPYSYNHDRQKALPVLTDST